MGRQQSKHAIAEQELLDHLRFNFPFCKFEGDGHFRMDRVFRYVIVLTDGPIKQPARWSDRIVGKYGEILTGEKQDFNLLSRMLSDSLCSCRHSATVKISKYGYVETTDPQWTKMYAMALLKR